MTTEARIELTVGAGRPAAARRALHQAGPAGAWRRRRRAPEAAGPLRRSPPAGLGVMLLLALLGGLILNAMPCVLPVLSLKVFGLVRSAGHGRPR